MSDSQRRLPNCIVIGAPRSGTTTLYEGLRRHPAIFMTRVKEPGYFLHHPLPKSWNGPGDNDPIRRGIVDIDAYRQLFAESGDATIVGEASVGYLSSPDAADGIRSMLPEARLIVVLRNPADRAFSQYSQHLQQGREPLASFDAAIAAEAQRLADGWAPFWGYVELGYYARQLQPWLERFPRERIAIYLYDDLERDTTAFVREVYHFLDVDPTYDPRLADNINASGAPRSRTLHRLLTRDNALKRVVKPLVPQRVRLRARNAMTQVANRNLVTAGGLDPMTRRQLLDRYHDDIRELERILGRSLEPWLRDRTG